MADYIKREDVIEAMYRSCDSICPYSLSERKMVCGSCTRGKVFDVIKNEIPAADVRENVTAEWEERIVEDSNPLFRRRFYCSACGKWQTYGKTSFCMDCGADMRRRDNE